MIILGFDQEAVSDMKAATWNCDFEEEIIEITRFRNQEVAWCKWIQIGFKSLDCICSGSTKINANVLSHS